MACECIHSITVEEMGRHVADTSPAAPLVVDTRPQKDFAAGFIPGAVFAGSNGPMAQWLAYVAADVRRTLVIADHSGDPMGIANAFRREGFTGAILLLKGGTAAWRAAGRPTASVKQVPADKLPNTAQLVDCRTGPEWRRRRLRGARRIELTEEAPTMAKTLDATAPAAVYCGVGWRSLMFISLCYRHGYRGLLLNVDGGIEAVCASDALRGKLLDDAPLSAL